jgi:hypothetical protein
MLKERVTYLPFHTCVEQSPKCLVANHVGPCQHKHCLSAYKRPEWWGLSIQDFYNKEQFTQFDIHKSPYGPPHIIPKNPNPGARDGFEGFRQSMNAISHLAGSWPSNIKVVAREHVQFRWTEFNDSYPVTIPGTTETLWMDRLDVQEYAYYIGPTDGIEIFEVDINADYGPVQAELVRAAKSGVHNV